MSYDEIHKGEAAAVNVGVDLTQLTAGMMAGSADETPSVATNGVDAGCEVEPVLPAFHLVWNDTEQKYEVNAPAVYGPDGAITVSDDGEGYYDVSTTVYLKVTNTAGEWAATLVTDADASDEHTVALIEIASIDASGEVDQKHVGAVVVGALGEKVTVKGAGDDARKIVLDPSELDDLDMEVHTLTVGDSVYYVLASEDIEIEEGGVTSIKSLTGDVDVIGGEGIAVTVEGQTIKISYQEGKESDEAGTDDEKDPCDHPGGKDDGGDGGVSLEDGGGTSGGGASGYGSDGGGVAIIGDGGDSDDDGHPSGGCKECGG